MLPLLFFLVYGKGLLYNVQDSNGHYAEENGAYSADAGMKAGRKAYMNIDVIIPLYKPGKELFQLLDMLEKQTMPVQNIILMNTEEKYFEQLAYGKKGLKILQNVKVFHLSKKEFDHGGTRRKGVAKSTADVFVMMTQDAVPTDTFLIEKLTQNLTDNVAVAYARQLPKADCGEAEKISRAFNYPGTSRVKTKDDLEELGVKTYFCSNVCAAYRRDIYEKLGGFTRHTIFNEDMIYAAAVIKEGYGISYEAEARVIHSHNYTNIQQLRRNFDLGVSQAEHPEVFDEIPSESEGKKLVKTTTEYFRRHHMLVKLPGFYMQCAFKYTGYLLGKHYKKLPRGLVRKITTNREYWEK